MSKLIWFLLDWMFDDGKQMPNEDDMALRRTYVHVAKRVVFGLFASYIVWSLGGFAARITAQTYETLASVVWVGDASYDSGTPANSNHASASHRVVREEARLLVDGVAEPLSYTTGPHTLTSRFSVGERVRVRYSRGTFLFWDETSISDIAKLDETFRRPLQ